MSDQTKPRVVSELRATAQLMTLESGVFCVFGQGPVVTDASGLPGVRISRPPGAASEAGSVTISTFRDDGWLGGADSAALIRIAGPGPGQVLVTVYQSPTGTEAPRLQVVRLTDVPPASGAAEPGRVVAQPGGQPDAGAPAPGAGPALIKPSHPQPAADQAEVSAHVNRMGDVLALMGSWVGEQGSKRWIEGFSLSPKNGVGLGDIEYQAVLGRDWLSPWAEGGQYCGSRGMSLPLLGLRVRLRGEAAKRFDVALEASFVTGAVVGPVQAGEACETADLAALEAFRVVLTAKGAVQADAGQGQAPVAKAPRRRATAEAAAAAPVADAEAPAGRGRRAAAPAPAAARTPARGGGKPAGGSRRR